MIEEKCEILNQIKTKERIRMCSVCNPDNYVLYAPMQNSAPMRKRFDNPYLDLNCDLSGKDFKIGEYRVYYCPTCGELLPSHNIYHNKTYRRLKL